MLSRAFLPAVGLITLTLTCSAHAAEPLETPASRDASVRVQPTARITRSCRFPDIFICRPEPRYCKLERVCAPKPCAQVLGTAARKTSASIQSAGPSRRYASPSLSAATRNPAAVETEFANGLRMSESPNSVAIRRRSSHTWKDNSCETAVDRG